MDSTFQFLVYAYPLIQREIIHTICQTLLYGIYSCLVLIAINIMATNGLQSQARKWLFALTTSMFALSTVEWIFSVTLTLIFVNWWGGSIACYESDDVSSCISHMLKTAFLPAAPGLEMIDNIVLINYVIADGIIVWRAWVLCSDQSRVVLVTPVVMLAINTVMYVMTVVLCVIEAIWTEEMRVYYVLGSISHGTQLAHLSLSLLINIFATSIIALKAWKYRKLMMESGIGVRTPRQAARILALLVESGVIYILIGVTNLTVVFTFGLSGNGQIAGIFWRLNTALAGMYPIVVIILVEKNRSLNTTLGSFGTTIDVRGGRMPVEPMSFAPGPVPTSGGQIDLATKPPQLPNADIHVTFTELGDEEISSGRRRFSSEEHSVP